MGDVIFFAVSGYCLYNVKTKLSLPGFAKWYGKRIWRVYPPVLIMTALFMLLGFYTLKVHGLFWWYVFPTYYHFVGSIIILYIPFFFIMKIPALREKIVWIMAGVGIVWLALYFTVYDRSYYHIDMVREPMIRFLFMESMLLGAWFRQNDEKLRNKFRAIYPVMTGVVFFVYAASKYLFSRKESLAFFQFLNQIVLFVLLFFIFRTFCGLDEKLEKMPSPIKKIIRFVSDMTLEIYVVQYVLINVIRGLGLVFPLNWLILTACILLAAFILHFVCSLIYKGTDKALSALTARRKK